MKKIHIVGLALVAVLAFGALSVTSAFALESVWLVNSGKPASQVAVKSHGELLLEDTKGGLFKEAVDILCKGTDAGFVGPGKEDLIETITVTECKTDSGTCPNPTAKPINTPWLSTIELIGSSFYDNLVTEKSGATTLGYEVVCLGSIEDKCELTLARALLENGTNIVNAIFNPADANQPAATCQRGGAGAGLVEGIDVNETNSGESLAVSEG